MMQTTTLSLGEQLLLLALDDEKGTVASLASMPLGYGLAGAAILYLTLMDRLAMDGKSLVAVNAASTNDDILDEALAEITSAVRARDPRYWVGKLATDIKHHRERLAERLVQRGILHHEEHRILGIIPSQRYPTDNPQPAGDVRNHIRAVVLDGATADTRTVLLISLAKACSLLDSLFSREERKGARQRVEQMTREEAVGKAVTETVASVTAAVIAATTAATVGASTATMSASSS